MIFHSYFLIIIIYISNILVRKQTQGTVNQEMTYWIQQNQQIPKLAKNKPLENPYQSSIATAATELSNIFLLNDRRKVTLTESSEDQQQEMHHCPNQPDHRFPTFQPRNAINMSESGMEASISEKNIQYQPQYIPQRGRNLTQKSQKQQKNFTNNTDYSKINSKTSYENAEMPTIPIYIHNKYDNIKTPQFAPAKIKNTPQMSKGTPNESQQYSNEIYIENGKKQYFYQTPQESSYANEIPDEKQSSHKELIQYQKKQIDKDYKKKSKPKIQLHKPTKKSNLGINNSYEMHFQYSQPNSMNNSNINDQQTEKFVKIDGQLKSKIKKQEVQVIADEESALNLLPNVTQLTPKSNSKIKPLTSASKVEVIENAEKLEEIRESFIDKIKAETFCESRVIEENQTHHKNKDVKTANSYIINISKLQENQNTQIKLTSGGTTARKRLKIFQNSEKKQNRSTTPEHSKIYQTPMNNMSNQQKYYYNHHQYTNSSGPKVEQFETNIMQTNDRLHSKNAYNKSIDAIKRQIKYDQNTNANSTYAICPHTQCILKSLQIIDKLTTENLTHKNNNDHSSLPQSHVNKSTKAEQIQNTNMVILRKLSTQSLDISMQLDRILAEVTLENILKQDTFIKVKRIKIEIQRLLTEMKQIYDQEGIMKKKDQSLQQSHIKHLTIADYKWELCTQLQKMSKNLHYIQVVQERYQIWKMRLNGLSERIKDILKVERPKQLKKLADLVSHIAQLEQSRFYGLQATEIGIVQAYNIFIGKQIQQLNSTINWVKTNILSQ